MSRKEGAIAEQHACDYLKTQGLRWVESNYSCRLGEIDLIMRDNNYLVFVEVRSRTSLAFGGALGSISFSKQQKLLRTASLYLLMNKLHDKQPIRFDVVCMEGAATNISWIKNAFGSDF